MGAIGTHYITTVAWKNIAKWLMLRELGISSVPT